jgi:hypothetical protein
MIHHANQIVKLFTPSELSYSFDGQDPYYTVSHANGYAWQEKVKATPCYAHDVELVEVELARLQTIAPIPYPLIIAVFSHEFVGGTNGFARDGHCYDYESGKTRHHIGQICLCGKVIPIMPAMTRYLVSHEYGHVVEDHLERLRGLKDGQFRQQYIAEIRPDAQQRYGPGHWHANVGELIANDFRHVVSERELEFWPHPGFARPHDVPAVVDFWKQAQTDLLNAEINVDKV